jgi:hypothetical protein
LLDLYQFIIAHYDESSCNVPLFDGLGIYLSKLKLGLHKTQISAILPPISVYQCKKMVISVRDLLSEHFVPFYLGMKSTLRSEVSKSHTSIFARTLLGAEADQAITIWDGTYIYIQNSSSYSFQHRTYSGHKYRNLAKFMMLVSTDDYIIDTIGPYLADGKNNDAKIMEDIFRKNVNDIEDFFENRDIFIVDRGFRDSIQLLKDNNFIPSMPSYIPNSQKQHTDLEANQSRIIIEIRWVVEAKNVQVKKFEYFNNVVLNIELKHLEKDFKFICALLNKYRDNIKKNKPEDNWKAKEMLNNTETTNAQAEIFQSFHNKRSKQSRIKSDPMKVKFPKLNESYKRSLTFGVYQLKQARSYTNEHLDETSWCCTS